MLGPIYCQEGRQSEALQLIEELWGLHKKLGTAASETAINQLRLYIQLQQRLSRKKQFEPLSSEPEIAPDDDRIWLWKARQAIRTRSFDEAEVGIDQCLKRRPEDPPVWHARLDWAVATRRVALVVEAIKHLPSAELDARRLEKLRAWLAAQDGDAKGEQTSLERLIAIDPTDGAAWDRLIELYVKTGRADSAAEQRRRKDEVAPNFRLATARCSRGTSRVATPRRWAGWPSDSACHFEARAYLTIALASARECADLRQGLPTRITDAPAGPAQAMIALTTLPETSVSL